MLKRSPKIILVTPCKNESENLRGLATSINNLRGDFVYSWVIVVNGSTDNSIDIAKNLEVTVPLHLLNQESSGNLNDAPEFAAFLLGANNYFHNNIVPTHVMKLDADVILENDYFLSLFESADLGGISGGSLPGEQNDTVPGAVKLYSREAYDVIRSFPIALGFDVLDEIAIQQKGLPISINKESKFRVVRKTASSQGILRGRFRSGKVCRWTGYFLPYFLLRVIRYSLRSPYGIGAMAMCMGYFSAGEGPWDKNLKKKMRLIQKMKFYRLIKNPRLIYSIYN